MNNFRLLFQIFLVIVFLAGIYVLVWFDGYAKKEGFETTSNAIDTTSASIATTSSNDYITTMGSIEDSYLTTQGSASYVTTQGSSSYVTTSSVVVTGPDGTAYTVSGTDLVDANTNTYSPDSDGYITGADGSRFNTDANGNYYSIDNNSVIYDMTGAIIEPDGVLYVLGPDATFYFVDETNGEFMDVNDNIYTPDENGNIFGVDESIFNKNPQGKYYCIDTNKIVYDYTGTNITPDGISSLIGPDGTFYFVDPANSDFVDANLNRYLLDTTGTIIGADETLFNVNPSATFFGVDKSNVVYDFTGSQIYPDGINYILGPDSTFYFIDATNNSLVDVNLSVYPSDDLGQNIIGSDGSTFNVMPPDNIYYSFDINNIAYDFTGTQIMPDGISSIIGPDGTFYFIIVATDPDGNPNVSFMTTSNAFFYANSDGIIIGLDESTFQKDRSDQYYSTNQNGYIFGPDGIIRGQMPITAAPITTAYAAPVDKPLRVANNDLYTFPPRVTMPPGGALPSYETKKSDAAQVTSTSTTTTLSPQNIDKSYSDSTGVNAQNDYTFPPGQITDNSSYSDYDPLSSDDISKYEYVSKTDISTQPDGLSDNPMDPNWGGVVYTQKMLDEGKYKDNIVTKPLLFQPKGLYLPAVPSVVSQPKDIY